MLDMSSKSVRFYMKNGRWKVKALVNPVPAAIWWAAIAEVKCMNHKLRQSTQSVAQTR